jgi:hypothetical protein
MNVLCKIMAHSPKLYASSATQNPENNHLEECTFMATNNAANNKSSWKSPVFLPELTKFEFSRQIFTGVITWKLHEILSTERRADTGGQTKHTKELFLSTVFTHIIMLWGNQSNITRKDSGGERFSAVKTAVSYVEYNWQFLKAFATPNDT